MEVVTDTTKVKSIYTYFGEGRINDIDPNLDGLNASVVFVQNKEINEVTTESIMLEGTELIFEDYDNESGLLKVGFSPSLPLWVFQNFAGYFIPIFEK